MADWLLEVQERLALVGLATDDRFPLSLTQEMLAGALGLTSVHVNRTMQALRRGGLLTAARGHGFAARSRPAGEAGRQSTTGRHGPEPSDRR